MVKQIECITVDSRPLGPCRAISHHQPDNYREDRYSNPPRQNVRGKTSPRPIAIISDNPKKSLAFKDGYPHGMVVNTLA